jgi:hypothetical protein
MHHAALLGVGNAVGERETFHSAQLVKVGWCHHRSFSLAGIPGRLTSDPDAMFRTPMSFDVGQPPSRTSDLTYGANRKGV